MQVSLLLYNIILRLILLLLWIEVNRDRYKDLAWIKGRKKGSYNQYLCKAKIL
jgi:hypothetical protein